MRLKYYLRGLGIGIAVTALVLAISGDDKAAAMTDEQIMARAKELGMTEAAAELAEAAPEKEELPEKVTFPEEILPEKEQPDKAEETKSDTQQKLPVVEEKETQTKQETKEPAKTDAKADTKKPDTQTEAAQKPNGESAAKTVLITINGGDTSVAVSKRVAEAGLAESAAAYDAFLCQNGYDKKLAVGVHEIPADATAEEIAKILTTRKK